MCPSSELSITSSIHGTPSNSIARLLGNRPTPSIDASQARQLALRHNQGSDRGFQARLLKRGLIVLRPSTSPSEFFSWPFAALSALPPQLDSLPRHASSFKFFKLLKQILLVHVVILSCDSLIVATSLWTFRDVCSVLLHMHSQASCNDKFRSSLLLQSSSFYAASPTLTYFVKRHIKFLTARDKPTRQACLTCTSEWSCDKLFAITFVNLQHVCSQSCVSSREVPQHRDQVIPGMSGLDGYSHILDGSLPHIVSIFMRNLHM